MRIGGAGSGPRLLYRRQFGAPPVIGGHRHLIKTAAESRQIVGEAPVQREDAAGAGTGSGEVSGHLRGDVGPLPPRAEGGGLKIGDPGRELGVGKEGAGEDDGPAGPREHGKRRASSGGQQRPNQHVMMDGAARTAGQHHGTKGEGGGGPQERG